MCDGDGRGTTHTAGGLCLQPRDWMCWRGTGLTRAFLLMFLLTSREHCVILKDVLLSLGGKQENMGGREAEGDRKRESARDIYICVYI